MVVTRQVNGYRLSAPVFRPTSMLLEAECSRGRLPAVGDADAVDKSRENAGAKS